MNGENHGCRGFQPFKVQHVVCSNGEPLNDYACRVTYKRPSSLMWEHVAWACEYVMEKANSSIATELYDVQRSTSWWRGWLSRFELLSGRSWGWKAELRDIFADRTILHYWIATDRVHPLSNFTKGPSNNLFGKPVFKFAEKYTFLTNELLGTKQTKSMKQERF